MVAGTFVVDHGAINHVDSSLKPCKPVTVVATIVGDATLNLKH
jgi:hypothetical protein